MGLFSRNLGGLFSRGDKNRTVPRRRLEDRRNDEDVSAGQQTLQAPGASAFRRNQTLVGSSSINVNSVASHDPRVQSTRASAHELRRRQRSLWSMFLVTVFAAVGLFIVVYQSVLQVQVTLYGQVGALTQSQEQSFQTAVNQYYGSNPLQRIRLLFSPDAMLRYLQTHGHAEVSSFVSLQPQGIGQAVITLKVREPIASWTINGNKHYVDGKGTVFDSNFYQEPKITIIDKSNVENANNGVIASQRFLQFIGVATGRLHSYGDTVKDVVIPANTTRQIQFVLRKGTTIKMTVDRSVGEQCEDAARALTYLESKGRIPDYIDVRVSRKAYYK